MPHNDGTLQTSVPRLNPSAAPEQTELTCMKHWYLALAHVYALCKHSFVSPQSPANLSKRWGVVTAFEAKVFLSIAVFGYI